MALLRNLLDAVEPGSPGLRHVTFYQGGKAYGADLGPFKTPARQDDPRRTPPSFHDDQEDLLRARGAGASPPCGRKHGLRRPSTVAAGELHGGQGHALGADRREARAAPVPYDALVSWGTGDFIFNSGFDSVSSTIKARQVGFGSCIDTEHLFRAFFDRLRQDKVIPPA